MLFGVVTEALLLVDDPLDVTERVEGGFVFLELKACFDWRRLDPLKEGMVFSRHSKVP